MTTDKTPGSRLGKRRWAALSDAKPAYSAKREELIRVAAAVFTEKGYEATTFGDIALRMGADRASLYYYVGSKEELLQFAVGGVFDEQVVEANRIFKLDATANEKLRQVIRHLIDSYEKHYPYMYLYIQEDMRLQNKGSWARRMVRQSRRLQTITEGILQQGIDEGTFRSDFQVNLAANALFGTLNWTHRWFKPGTGHSADEVSEVFYRIFFEGLQSSS